MRVIGQSLPTVLYQLLVQLSLLKSLYSLNLFSIIAGMKYPKFLLPVLLPWLLFAIYQLFLTARLFEVESRFVVKQMQENVSPIEMGMGFLAGAPSSAMEDSALVQEYIASPNLMEILDKQLDLRSHFEKFGLDYLKYFDGATSKEKFLKRYRKMVKIKIRA